MSDIKWIFSGVGVAIIAGIIALIKWLIKRRRAQETPEPSLNGASLQDIIDAPPPPKQEPDIKATSLSPMKIRKEIKSAPLLQQSDLCKQYEGVKVSWKGELAIARKEDENTIRIMINVYEEKKGSDKKANTAEYVNIFFNVDPKLYPGIGLLREGHEIFVEGRIEEVSTYITLKAEKLVFDIDDSD